MLLYINNWNEDRLEIKEVANYFEQMRTELESDITHFNNDISKMRNWSNYLNKVSEEKYNEVDLSLLLTYLPRNLNSRNFGISYNKLLETGIIRHIEGNPIDNKLQTYYLTNCAEYNSRTEFHANFISDHIEGPLLLLLNHKKDFLVNSSEVIEELENGNLRSFVNWQLSYFEFQVPQIEENIVQAKELINLIEKK